MKSDVEIAQENIMLPILDIAKKLDIPEDDVELYGKYKCKISQDYYRKIKDKKDGKLILVTAINPTPAGEGKTTTSIGIGDALNKLGKKVVIALREPSLGPCFGLKGGAAGGGYSQVVPMEDINLHFTGDFHAITSAHNLLAATIDNHIKHGNALDIDVNRITWKRVLDLNDRALRNIICGLGGAVNGVPRETGFDITVASEMMAILCLTSDLEDMKRRLGNIVIAFNRKGEPIFAKDLNITGALTLLFKDAIKPNLVQTLEHTPAIIHGGPFANIAHGCNSVMATKYALKMADYVVTEAGFGADLGAEKFLDIKCRFANLNPALVVVVATIRALKMHGGVPKEKLDEENIEALKKGFSNLKRHIENMKKFNLPVVVAINAFPKDNTLEMDTLKALVKDLGVDCEVSKSFTKGGEGAIDLGNLVLKNTTEDKKLNFIYDTNESIEDKIKKIATEIYGAKNVEFTSDAKKTILDLEKYNLDKMPICMAKTQYSFSDNPNLLGAPTDFTITVREIRLSAGAGFIVALTGNVLTMPGLPKKPAAENMDIDINGKITGLF